MISPNSLRIGNLIQFAEDGTEFTVIGIDNNGLSVNNSKESTWIESDEFEGIPLTSELLVRLGFETLPHANLLNSHIKRIGRNRIISIGNVGTPNEMIWLCEVNATDDKVINDLVCVKNYDYDGYTHVHTLQNIHHSLTGQELTIKQ